MTDFKKLRDELDQIDQGIIDLVAKRLRIVEKVHQKKQKEHQPLFDRNREQEILRRIGQYAETKGVQEEMARELMRLLIDESQRYQLARHQADRIKTSNQYDGKNILKKILVVGGRGKMGHLFAQTFKEHGCSVQIFDIEHSLDTMEIQKFDVIFIAVPMSKAREVIEKIAPLAKKESLIVDINSLKVEVCKELEKSAGESMGTHPMFGSSIKSFRRQKIIVCSLKEGPLGQWFLRFLEGLGVEVIETDPKTHDEMMAIVQVLTHFHVIVMGHALKKLARPVRETLRFTSPIYRLELAIIGRLFAQDPTLYAEIEMSNPSGHRVREAYLESARVMKSLIESEDRETFVTIFQEIGEYFEDFSAEAMNLSDEIIDGIVAKA